MQSENIQALERYITDNCNAIDADARYREMLDECYSFKSVGGIFANMLPSRVLEECDPIAFRCGFNDYLDGEEWVEIDGEYYESRDDVEKARDEFIDELDSEMSDLSDSLEEVEAEAEEEEDAEKKADELRGKIADLEDRIAEARKHTF